MATILIADDDVGTTHSMLLLFEGEGHTCLTASNGQEAIELVHKHEPQIVFMDLAMPVMDGFAATASIRALPIAQPRVVALSVLDGPDIQTRAALNSFDLYLRKPASTDTLLTVIDVMQARHSTT
jgi:CheY-like chemotaxis protein